MKIKHTRLLVARSDGPQILPKQHVGEQPEIPSTARGPVGSHTAHCRNRYFHKRAGFEGIERKTGLFGDTVEIVTDGKRARAVFVAGFLESVVHPKIPA